MNISSLKNHSSLISLAILLLMIGGIAFFVIRPLRTTIINKARSIQELYAREENQTKQVNRLPELKRQYTNIEEKSPALDILLNEDQIVGFIQTLEGVARETNVTLVITSNGNGAVTDTKKAPAKTVKTTGGEDSPDDKKNKGRDIISNLPFDVYLRLNIKVSGTYRDIIAFIHKIETLSVSLDVVGIDMKRSEIEKDVKKAEVNPNPFFSSFGSGSGTAESTQVPEGRIDLLEAVLDVLVYVNK